MITMKNVALKTRPAQRRVKPSVQPRCEAKFILGLLAKDVIELEALKPYDKNLEAVDAICALMDSRLRAAARSVPRSEVGQAFQMLTLYRHSFTNHPDRFMPKIVREGLPDLWADLCQREDLRIAASLQLTRSMVEGLNDPDLNIVAKHYLPVSAAERRDMLKSCGVTEWKRA